MRICLISYPVHQALFISASITQNVSRATQRKEAWLQQALWWEQEERLRDTILNSTFVTVAAQFWKWQRAFP